MAILGLDLRLQSKVFTVTYTVFRLLRRNELFETNLLEVERAIVDLEGRVKKADLEVVDLEVISKLACVFTMS